MTTIDTAENLIRILRQDPEILDQVRRAVLTDELLELPEKFAEMAETQARILEIQARMLERQDRAEEMQARMLERQDRAEEIQARMLERQDRMEETQARILETQDRMLGRQDRMEETQARILETQDRMLGRQDRMEEIQTGLIEGQQRLEDRVGYLVGAELERRVFRILPTRLRQMYGLRRTRVILRQGDYTPDTQTFLEDIDNALDSSLITERQRDRLVLTDLIVRATRPRSQEVIYLAVEASGTIARRDIDRASAASEALSKLYQVETLPVVAGYRIHRADQEYAKAIAMRTIILEEEEL